MDTVIFTGKVHIKELKEDRPKEYEAIMNDPELQKKIGDAPPKFLERASRIFGFTALITGIVLILLIIYSMIFLYQ